LQSKLLIELERREGAKERDKYTIEVVADARIELLHELIKELATTPT
jgi:hypothetical protein